MKKILATILLSSVLTTGLMATCISAETKEDIKFREFEWGATLDEVKEKEIKPSMKEKEDYIVYDNLLIIDKQTVAGVDCIIDFEFDKNGGLTKGTYTLNEKHTNEQEYYTDFKTIIEKLTEKYGEPDLNQEVWTGDLYKDRPDKQGMGVITGNLKVIAQWKDKDGNEIGAFLTGDNYECSGSLYYISKEYNDSYKDDTSGL